MLKRGAWESKGEPVGPRPLSVLVSDSLKELPGDVPNPRTRLASWLVDPSNPLTARVLVNRVWLYHFGTGLVKTPNDFGTRGDKPSHPDLLNWLAASLVENGWKLKPIHRLIVLSQTYQQGAEFDETSEAARADPENRLLAHFPRRRLSAEEIRDAMLAASGRLNLKAGGPSVMIPVESEFLKLLYNPAQWKVTPDPLEHDRRTIYLFAKRNMRLPFLETFDAPTSLSSCARRESSTHAPQALELLNGKLANDLALSFAARLKKESGGDPARLVDRAFLLTMGRLPDASERTIAADFLKDGSVEEFALAVFNLNGFLYVH